MKRILQLGALAVALIGGGGAQAIPLSTLLSGGSITAGDKVFDQWSVVSYESSEIGRVLNAANIEVTALNDGGLDPGPGLSFAVSNGELDVTGDGFYSFVDFAFGFRVTAGAGFAIKDNSLDITTKGLSVSVHDPRDEDLGVKILEWVSDDLVTDPATPGYIDTEFSMLAGVPTSKLTASSQFAPRQEIWVTKDILVWADFTDMASLTGFTQRFSQQAQAVPEPGSLALVALALTGLGVVRRRRG